ncbi:MAG: GntR family transcriptional regulator [Clostridia bacterium]|nr:GntR family transcriptional regulator [Clostridia bacterium]
MAWSFTSDKLIYLQIAERITLSVLSGEYKSGEQIPSVRQLAIEAAVNPNTVQHAFSELEKEGLIVSKGTIGRYVTDNTDIIESCRKKTAEQTIKSFVKSTRNLGLSNDEIITMLREELT